MQKYDKGIEVMRKWFSKYVVAVGLCIGFMVQAGAEELPNLWLCGGKTVLLYSCDGENEVLWQWEAADSSEIPEAVRPLFTRTDECKPIGPYVLITSSGGGVALIERDDHRCAFYTRARNAHSACLLPGMRVAVAASTGGDAVMIFDRRKSGVDVEPLMRIPLKGAHGVVWDGVTESCWALGTDELLELDRELAVVHRLPLPTPGGHDLSWGVKTNEMMVTSSNEVYIFDVLTRKFSPHPVLAEAAKVKSIDVLRTTGEAVYQQAMPGKWWGRTIRFTGKTPRPSIVLSDQRLYKIRWDVPAPTPTDEVVKKLEQQGVQVFRDSRGRVIEVSFNKLPITNEDLYPVAWFPYLTDLSAEYTGVSDDGLKYVAGLSKLEWLNLWQTQVGDEGLKHLENLTALERLPLGDTQVTDEGLRHLRKLKNLVYIGLRRTAVTDEGIRCLAAFPNLISLNLVETGVTDAAIPELLKLKGLQTLYLTDAQITDAGFKRLVAGLPDCAIER